MLNCQKTKKTRGFTLLEVSITMTVLGILMVFVMQAYSKYRVDQVRRITIENVKAANTKIVEYLTLNAKYPCPAALGFPRNDPNYGLEGNCSISIGVDGTCDANGTCVEQGARVVVPHGRPSVRRGALPFRALNMPESMSYDGYGNRIQYAVTERLTNSASYDPNHGTVEIIDANDVTVLKQPGTAQFIVFSSGVNAVGAYTTDGVRVNDCIGTANDVENCNTSMPNRQAIYRAMVHDLTSANYYDDIVAYDTTSEAPAWQFTDSSAVNARQVENDNVLVFDDEAATPNGARVEINGNVRVDGHVQTTRYCTDTVDGATPTNEECFESDKLAGETATGGGMECTDPNTVMTGIRNSAPICVSILSLGSCPAGQLMTGVDADLKPICDAVPVTCPDYTYSRCGDSFTYPASLHGAEVTSSAMGFSYHRRLRCNNGSWQYRTSWGHCSCTAGVYTQNYSCGTGFSGRRYRDVTTVCNGDGTITRTYDAWDRSGCSCIGATDTDTQNCPDDMSGQRTRVNTFNCGTESWDYGAWTTVADSCSCVPRAAQTRTVSCTNGMSGTRTEEKAYLCPDSTWSTTWTETANNCTCNPATTETKVASDCPVGQIGDVFYERTSACDQPGGGWGAWTEVSNTCRAQSCVWRPLGTSTPDGSYGVGAGGVSEACSCGRANTSCYLQKGANSYDNYAECACELQ